MGSISFIKQINGSFLLEGPGNGSIFLNPGYWIFQCWGASGGGSYHSDIQKAFPGGRGGYSVGAFFLNTKTKFFLTAGGSGSSNSAGLSEYIPGGFNGGGSGFVGSLGYPVGSGGGSSDVRIGGNDISDRILVAGGGGGGGAANSNSQLGQFGGDGGGSVGLEGGGHSSNYDDKGGKGGTQTSGGNRGYFSATQYGESGTLFYGGRGSIGNPTASSAGGGGGGYYGGGGGSTSGGGGGSGYIGGVSSAFGVEPCTYSGSTNFPSPFLVIENGHLGHGFVKITPIGLFHFETCKIRDLVFDRFSFILLIFSITPFS